MGVWTAAMARTHLSALLLAICLLNSAQAYRCMTQEDEDCRCIFPFKAEGTSYETCVDPFNEGGVWCATAIQSDGEYSDYGWCVEDLPPAEHATSRTETETVTTTEDVCAGQCEKPNQRCEVESGRAVCKCLEGYFDEKIDGNLCKCVRDWTNTGTQGQESRRDQSNDYNSGSTFEKSFEIPGDSRSASHSKAVAETEEFFQEFSGSISHTEASCVKFSARLNDYSPPAFTRDFKDMIREMDSLTEKLWDSNIETKKLDSGKLISWKNEENEKKFDALFEKFIENFGTHYIQKASMGGIQRLSSAIKSLKEDTGNIEQVENCLTKAIKEKTGDQSVQDGRSNDNCNNEDIENRVKSALETTEVQVDTFGAGATEDIYQWTTNSFLSPTLLPDFKLQPIVKLFQPNFMNRRRVTRSDGTAINHQRILSWLMPRYAILTGRCKLMKNHHVEEGKTCRANKDFLVSSRDGTEVTHLAALCQSLPHRVLLPNATECTWCPGGVDKARRRCKVDQLELYQLDQLELYQHEFASQS